MQKSRMSLKVKLAFGFGILVLLIMGLSRGPDFELHFKREIPSELDPERIFRNIALTHRWSQWYYHLDSIEGAPQVLTTGSHFILKMNPHKGFKKPFDLAVEITDYVPNRRLGLKILNDSTGRLTRLFDSLEWNIEVQPHPRGTGTLIYGTGKAHTCNWRSRLLGRLSERILMNQTFHPDLMKLSELKRPYQEALETREVDLLGSPNRSR